MIKLTALVLLALVAFSHSLPNTHKRLTSRLRNAKRGDIAAAEVNEATSQHKGKTQALTTHALKKWSLHPGENVATQAAAYAQGKRPVHERIFDEALRFLGTGHGIDRAALRKGVLWNDLPGPIEYDYLEVALMARDFLSGHDNDLVYATHKGCLQFWHAMSPRSGNYRFSPANVLDFMLNAAQFWWDRGVARGGANGDWWVGHIVHAIQDSFSPSHTLRSIEAVTGTTSAPNTEHDALGATCGKIYMYQDYSGQNGGAHDDAEKNPNPGGPPADAVQNRLQNCAIFFTWRFLHLWKECKSNSANCDFATKVRPMLAEQVWVNSGSAGLPLAGGTVDTYKDSGATGLTSQTITVPGVGSVAVSVPSTSAANPMWDTAPLGTFLCPTNMQGSRPGGTLPFDGVDGRRPRDYVNPQASPRGDFPEPSSDGPAIATRDATGPPIRTGKA